MTLEKFKQQITLVRQKAKITAMMAEATDTPTCATLHNLWKSAGELQAMVTALRSEAAGNEEPKRG